MSRAKENGSDILSSVRAKTEKSREEAEEEREGMKD